METKSNPIVCAAILCTIGNMLENLGSLYFSNNTFLVKASGFTFPIGLYCSNQELFIVVLVFSNKTFLLLDLNNSFHGSFLIKSNVTNNYDKVKSSFSS